MPNRLKPLNVFDFTGGVNLRPESFQLQENELPELVNMEVDPRGGINTRRGWVASIVDQVVPVGTTWDPRNAYLHVKSDGTTIQLVANMGTPTGGRIYASVNSAGWNAITTAPTANADPHGADFASWGDEAWVVRGTATTVIYDGTGPVTSLTACAAANWQNDYVAPGVTDTAPLAALVAQHQGYMFTAVTNEDTVAQPNRLRWSHPNNPKRWALTDYIDISEGGQRITALIPFSDRLLIFKPDSVWALFGYDADTWALTNISRTVGAANQQVVVRNEAAVFFMSWPQGVFLYDEKANINEISVQIRTVFQDKRMKPTAIRNSFMGWVGRRLWVSLPYRDELPAPDDAETVFVFDPGMGNWTLFRGADCVPGPFIERIEADDAESQLAFNRQFPYSLVLDGRNDKAIDECQPGMPLEFETALRTKWLDAGAPTWRKSWRRPDFLLRSLTFDTTINTQVFHDFDAYNAQRSFLVTYSPDTDAPIYTVDGDPDASGFVWGDGTNYGGSGQSSSVERGGTMGRAGAVQLLVKGEPGVTWGLNGIILKFVPRRFR